MHPFQASRWSPWQRVKLALAFVDPLLSFACLPPSDDLTALPSRSSHSLAEGDDPETRRQACGRLLSSPLQPLDSR